MANVATTSPQPPALAALSTAPHVAGARHYALYALPQFSIALVTLALLNYTPAFYAAEVGVAMLVLSPLILVSRATDVITDPLVGALSDRTRSRWGRRKPWMLLGVPVLLGSVWMLFHPGEGAGGMYFLVWFSLVFFGLTLIQLPYVSWGAELSDDYNTRTRIVTGREVMGAVGSITAIGVAIALALGGDTRLGPVLHILSVVLLVATPLLLLLAFRLPQTLSGRVPEPSRVEGSLFRDPLFRYFMGFIFLVYVGITPGGAMNYFLFDNVFSRPDLHAVNLLGNWTASLLGLAFWNRLATRIPKHRALALALLWIALGTALVPVAGAALGAWGAVAASAASSLALGAILALPYSVFADVIDRDALQTGEARTGRFMAVGGIVVKLALTAGIALAFTIPGLFGFDAASEANTDVALRSVALTFGWLPALFWLPAVWLAWRWPLGPEEVAGNRAALDRRALATGAAVGDYASDVAAPGAVAG